MPLRRALLAGLAAPTLARAQTGWVPTRPVGMTEKGAIDGVKCGSGGRHGVTLRAAPAAAGSSWASRSGLCCLAASSRSRSLRQAA